MGYGLMGFALSWPDDGLGEGGFMLDDGLGEGGLEQKFQGGPSPYFFFFFGKFLLAKKIFFLGPGGARAPLALYLGPSLVGLKDIT